jgi:Inner membrane protein CreD
LIRHIAALIFIFVCTTIAWMILGSTIIDRTHTSDQRLEGHVASTWGTAQVQAPPTASFSWWETVAVKSKEDGKDIVRNEKVERTSFLPLDATAVNVNLNLDYRQKGLLWYNTYVVTFAGDYNFHNTLSAPRTVILRLPLPAERALYDGLVMTLNGQRVPVSTDAGGAVAALELKPGEAAALHVAYRSQGMGSWRYKLADGVAQARNFDLLMRTNFKDIDFADDTLSPTARSSRATAGN